MEINSSDNLYEKCVEKYSLAKKKFCTFNDFQEIFQVNDQKMVINLLNVTCVEGDKVRPKELWKVIHKLDDNGIPYRDFIKDLTEFSSLSYLLLIYPDLHFQKSEKPDFILKIEDRLIGLEVTSAVSEVEKQVNKVAKFNFGRNKTVEDIQDYIDKNHRNITDKYGLYDINGKAVLSPSKGSVDCHVYKKLIVEKALNKAKKAKKYSSFSEMWVLIDTEDNLCFTEKHDAEELSKLFGKEDKNLMGISKVIVINVINKVSMLYDVKSQEFDFIRQESVYE
ncbi:MAG: hypothetical protein B6D38_12810 [Anaerolineae bacterium UTCFX1]|jgi:hypothetical protein|nr:MAG: hypothetical protein B6D38_12810 [Anaerolineae bacterium UTCFX1]